MRRRILGAYRRRQTWWNLLAFFLGAYLAVAAILEGAQTPSASAWRPWTGWFIAGLIAAIFVPAFALLKSIDAREQAHDAAEQELDADMARLCQELAAALSHECPSLRLEDVAVQIWLCDEKSGAFERRWRFFLPFDRRASGVVWRRGLGIAGTAWATGRDLMVSLEPLRRLTPEQFEALPKQQRYGMNHVQLAAASAYTGIIAIRLHAHDTGDRLLGMLVIDYSGSDAFDCMCDSLSKTPVTAAIGACARRLSSTPHA